MPSKNKNEKDPLQSLIAEILEAEAGGNPVDRKVLIDANPELADSLRDFFARHDHVKAVAAVDPQTIPPIESVDERTLPPTSLGDDATIPPTGSASAVEAPAVGDKVRYFGDYELIQEIARGGMGVVYKARQTNLNRMVALKMILAGQFAGSEDIQRFYTEAEAAAQLDHWGIVPIFEIGEHEGQHYFSMAYVEGESLADKIREGPLDPREAATLCAKIAEAMSYAHAKGVIHRDLKPANILLDRDGTPKVTDFGLAKQVESDSNLTGTGQILGTPAFMPPEQAAGKVEDVGPVADVYSLGAILYCLLTGRPPFQAASPMDTLLQVLDKEPVSPRTLIPEIPRDLETLCLKCLHKDPSRRYQIASDLSEELGRFLNGEPIQARPVGRTERVWRWCKREPVLASLAGAVAILLLAFGIGGPLVAWSQLRLRSRADEAAEIAQRNLYAAQMSLVQRDWRDGSIGSAKTLLNRQVPQGDAKDFRGFEWNYFQGLLNANAAELSGHGSVIESVAYSPVGNLMATASLDQLFLWDTQTSQLSADQPSLQGLPHSVILDLQFSPDGVTLAWTGSKAVQFWDLQQKRRLAEIPIPERTSLRAIDFSPDGESLAIAYQSEGEQGTIEVWNLKTRNKVRALAGQVGTLNCIQFSPDGKTLVSGGGVISDVEDANGASSELRIWDVASGEVIRTLSGHQKMVSDVEFTSDGVALVSSGYDNKVMRWEVATGKRVASSESVSSISQAILDLALHPDGSQAAVCSGEVIVLLETESLRRIGELKGHTSAVYESVYSPNGKRLLSGGEDVRHWRLDSDAGDLHRLPFSPTNGHLAPGGEHGVAWLKSRLVHFQLRPFKVNKLDRATNQLLHGEDIIAGAVTSDGNMIAVQSKSALVVLDGKNQQAIWQMKRKGSFMSESVLAFHIDDTFLCVSMHDKQTGPAATYILNARNGEEVLSIPGYASDVVVEGNLVASSVYSDGLKDIELSVRSLDSDELLFSQMLGTNHRVNLAIFDTTLFAGAGTKMWIFDAESGKMLRSIDGHASGILDVAFLPSDRT